MRRALQAALPWAAPVVTMAVVSISISLTLPLFALLLERMGASGAAIGFNHTLAAVAMVASAPILPAILARTGAVPLAVGALLAMAVAMAAIPLFHDFWWWGALRVVFGFSVTALFYVSEYWVVAQAPDARRGRIVALYAVVLSGSYMIGPVLLAGLSDSGFLIFAIPTAIILASLVPVLAGRRHAPVKNRDGVRHPAAMLRFLWTDPLVMWGVVLFGVIEFGAMGLITAWGLRTGYDEPTSVQLVFWLAFGSMALQLPVGWLAERMDRRYLLAAAGAVAVLMPLVIVWYAEVLAVVAAAIFVWGGMAVAMYTLALTELGARYRGAALAEANAAVVLGYSLGALIAPTLLGQAMDALPPDGMLWLASALGLAYLALAAVRLARHPRASS